jgi:adenylyltransferase/sulfurtransferase
VEPSLERHRRHCVLPEFGEDGQRRVAASSVVVFGCGALGGAAAMLLARAGVGRLVVVDRDLPERVNLHRQVLFDEADVDASLPKAEAAARKLRSANAEVVVEGVVADVDRTNVEALARDATLVVDGADNFELRLLANEACVRQGIPWVHGAVAGTYGVQWTVLPGQTACFSCLVEDAPPAGSVPTCETAGVFSPTVLAVASLQAAEALKVITGNAHRVRRTLLSFDLWTGERAEVEVARSPACPACVLGRFDHLEGRKGSRTTVLCGGDQVQVSAGPGARPSLDEVAARLPADANARMSPYVLRFSADGLEVALFPDGRAIVRGTTDPARARAVLAKRLGT